MEGKPLTERMQDVVTMLKNGYTIDVCIDNIHKEQSIDLIDRYGNEIRLHKSTFNGMLKRGMLKKKTMCMAGFCDIYRYSLKN